MKIRNPILRGMNPDPSVLRVGKVYYVAVSTFNWMPGIKVYKSFDLVNWKHETDILSNNIDLHGISKNCGIWAPTISYSGGIYFLMYTIVHTNNRPFKDLSNFLITAPSIKGPWSNPVYINSSGFDPSIFHDDDDRKWVVNTLWDYRVKTQNKSSGIIMQEYSVNKQKLIGPIFKIFNGTSLAKTEAPLIYKHGEYYYLVTAEGGTEKGHAITVCRSKFITGPYEVDPSESMLTASDKRNSPLQCTGHGSIVESIDGHWYVMYLCVRMIENQFSPLGRETSIQEVVWTDDNWVRLKNGTNVPEIITEVHSTKNIRQNENTSFHDDFSNGIKSEWNTWNQMRSKKWGKIGKNGNLQIISGESLQSSFNQHMIAVRQRDFLFEANTEVLFSPNSFNQMAGLVIYHDEDNYLYGFVTWDEESGKVFRICRRKNGIFSVNDEVGKIWTPFVKIKFMGNTVEGTFYYKTGSNWQKLGKKENLRYLSGGFSGNYVGISVQDLDQYMGSIAEFTFFDYLGKDVKSTLKRI
jgi:xylan 1,4-beta-xylosidase